MKKYVLILLSLSMFTFVNCKKDKNSEDQYEEKQVPVTTTNTDNSSPLSLFENIQHIFNSQSADKSALATTTTSNYEYDGRHIIKVTTTSGSDTSVRDYYYKDKDKGLLDSIVVNKNSQFVSVNRYTISNDKVAQITTFDANYQETQRLTFSNYNSDGQPGQLALFALSQSGDVNLSGSPVYTGGNLTSMSLSGSVGNYTGVVFSMDYTYDTKKNMLLNVETIEDPSRQAANNSIMVTTDISVGGTSVSNDTVTSSYTYDNDDYPITGTYSGTGSNGTLEIVYEDK